MAVGSMNHDHRASTRMVLRRTVDVRSLVESACPTISSVWTTQSTQMPKVWLCNHGCDDEDVITGSEEEPSSNLGAVY